MSTNTLRQESEDKQGPQKAAERFRQNLRTLIKRTGMTQEVAAVEIGIKYARLRKLCSAGLAKIPSREPKGLKQICNYFGIKRVRFLWSSTLLTDKVTTGVKFTPLVAQQLETAIANLTWLYGQRANRRTLLKITNSIELAMDKILFPEKGKRKRKSDSDGFRANKRYQKNDRIQRGKDGRWERKDDS